MLRGGGLVAFPTETVYGLGADASSPAALRRLYAVKGRPRDHPVIVHLGVGRRSSPSGRPTCPTTRGALADACWPGPLTLVLRACARGCPTRSPAGSTPSALRVPDQPVALALLRAFGGGVAAPSANRFGRVSPTTARRRARRPRRRRRRGARRRTVPRRRGVDDRRLHRAQPAILRLGGVPRERVEDAARSRRSPVRDRRRGARARARSSSHYAPRARVEVVEATELVAACASRARSAARGSASSTSEAAARPAARAPWSSARRPTPTSTRASLYRMLRAADDAGARRRARGAAARGRASAPRWPTGCGAPRGDRDA